MYDSITANIIYLHLDKHLDLRRWQRKDLLSSTNKYRWRLFRIGLAYFSVFGKLVILLPLPNFVRW